MDGWSKRIVVNTSVQVMVDDEWCPLSGAQVYQDSVLGLVLFRIFISDLGSGMK